MRLYRLTLRESCDCPGSLCITHVIVPAHFERIMRLYRLTLIASSVPVDSNQPKGLTRLRGRSIPLLQTSHGTRLRRPGFCIRARHGVSVAAGRQYPPQGWWWCYYFTPPQSNHSAWRCCDNVIRSSSCCSSNSTSIRVESAPVRIHRLSARTSWSRNAYIWERTNIFSMCVMPGMSRPLLVLIIIRRVHRRDVVIYY